MHPVFSFSLAILLGYLLGCSNMAYYLSVLRGVDFRSAGSRNLGASNAMMLLGWKAAVLVGLHDIGKAALAVWLAARLFPDLPLAAAAAGAAAVLGHIYPFWLGFRGGKGFASYLGMTLGLNWKLALAVMLAVLIIALVTNYIVLGTFTTIAAVPIGLGLLSGSWLLALLPAAVSAVILWKHRENIVRLRNGTEFGLRQTSRGQLRSDRKEEKKQ